MTDCVTIIGIDPGSRITGFGVVACTKTTQRCLTAGTIVLKHPSYAERVEHLYAELTGLMQNFSPDELAIEQVFVHKNASSALKLGQARGVALAALLPHGCGFYEYAPRQIKQAVTGSGRAAKEQVQLMVKRLLNLNTLPPSDAADALAVALCHAHMRQTKLLSDMLAQR